MRRLRVLPGGTEHRVEPGQTLLQATLGSAEPVPSSCRNGTCRRCLSRLVEGRIRHRIDWPGLSADEKAEGWILPCVAEPETDVTIRHG